MENVLVSSPLSITRGFPARVWTGRVLTGLLAALLLADAFAKLARLAPVIEATQKVGYAAELVRPLGIVLALSTLLHLIPRTQFIGAVLVTAYLGGATATQVRLGGMFWLPVVMGALLWIAYSLRSAGLRAFLLSTSR
jgi:DoxX-like family